MAKSVTIKAAWIGAIAIIAAALIGLVGLIFFQEPDLEFKTEGSNSPTVVSPSARDSVTIQDIGNYYNIQGDATFLNNDEVIRTINRDIKYVDSENKKRLVFMV